jgi:large subunit ribosomal protein L54
MFCTRCLRATAARRQLPLLRNFSTSRTLRNPDPPLSTPVTEVGETPSIVTARSICPEGTVLKGLNYQKGGQDPVAKKDEEYPEWLWSCLDVMKKAEAADEDAGDEFCKPSTFQPGPALRGNALTM